MLILIIFVMMCSIHLNVPGEGRTLLRSMASFRSLPVLDFEDSNLQDPYDSSLNVVPSG